MRKSKSRTRAWRLARAAVATAATAAFVLSTASPASAAAVTLTLSSTTGSNTGGVTITGTSSTAFLTSAPLPVAYFTQATCPLTWTVAGLGTPVSPSVSGTGIIRATAKKLSNVKVAITVPAGPVAGIDLTDYAPAAGTPVPYKVCVYASATASSPVLATGTYTVAAPATLTSITPTSGPAMGGSTVTIVGTGFPTSANLVTATLGGTAMTIVSSTATAITALTPAHAPEDDADLVVKTNSGTFTLANAFDFVNGLKTVPNTAPSSQKFVDIDVFGSGFQSDDYTFDVGALDESHVYLTNDVYNPAVTNTTEKVLGPVSECTNVLVVSDLELICTLVLSQRIAAAASYTAGTTDIAANYVLPAVRTVSTGSPNVTGATVTSTAAAFTAADVGRIITSTGGATVIPTGTYIRSVESATSATMSVAATTDGAPTSFTIGVAARALTTNVSTTEDSNVITTSGSFIAGDVGRNVASAGNLPVGTIITSVSADLLTATVSKNALATATAQTATISDATFVPDGAYALSLVTSGVVGAQLVAGYKQSVISSESVFTVAPY